MDGGTSLVEERRVRHGRGPGVLAALALVGIVVAAALLVLPVDVEPMGDSVGYRCSPLSEHATNPHTCDERVRPRLATSAWLAVGSSVVVLVAVAWRGRRYVTAPRSLRLIGDLYLTAAVVLTAVAVALLATDRLAGAAATGAVAGLFGLLTFAAGADRTGDGNGA